MRTVSTSSMYTVSPNGNTSPASQTFLTMYSATSSVMYRSASTMTYPSYPGFPLTAMSIRRVLWNGPYIVPGESEVSPAGTWRAITWSAQGRHSFTRRMHTSRFLFLKRSRNALPEVMNGVIAKSLISGI